MCTHRIVVICYLNGVVSKRNTLCGTLCLLFWLNRVTEKEQHETDAALDEYTKPIQTLYLYIVIFIVLSIEIFMIIKHFQILIKSRRVNFNCIMYL